MLRTILFDLDGTLLPMDQDEFARGYLAMLARKLAPYGFAPDATVKAIWAGTAAMVKNDGSRTNEAAFWETFVALCGERVLAHRPVIDEFYAREFDGAKRFCGFDPMAAQAVRTARALGLRTVLATNPYFPDAATRTRIRWAGLAPEDFECYTTYEDCRYCKPNPKYFTELLARIGASPDECLMVGNDAKEDTAAEALGIPVFLVTNCLINSGGRDISAYPQGDLGDLIRCLKEAV